jgi:hypothetical protein
MESMASRETVVVELAAEVRLAAGTSRAQRIAELRHASADAKQRFLQEVEQLRAIDPALEISSQDTMFPVLVITATAEVVVALRTLPGVVRVSQAPENTLVGPIS